MNAPDRIYLQVSEETWCEDRIHASDVEYTRGGNHTYEAYVLGLAQAILLFVTVLSPVVFDLAYWVIVVVIALLSGFILRGLSE